MTITCLTCGLEVKHLGEHGDPWQCIAALRRQLALYRRGALDVLHHIEASVALPTDDGGLRISDPAERAYWSGVAARMRERLGVAP
jgi:hypothetical protein